VKKLCIFILLFIFISSYSYPQDTKAQLNILKSEIDAYNKLYIRLLTSKGYQHPDTRRAQQHLIMLKKQYNDLRSKLEERPGNVITNFLQMKFDTPTPQPDPMIFQDPQKLSFFKRMLMAKNRIIGALSVQLRLFLMDLELKLDRMRYPFLRNPSLAPPFSPIIPPIILPPKKQDTKPPLVIKCSHVSRKFYKDRIISNAEFTDTTSISVVEIQRFLERKNSVLAKPYRGRSVAEMIYYAALSEGINPKVLLVKLQKEQGLITARHASKKKLDWALGVGCYDSGRWNEKYRGFEKQIRYAARILRKHYDIANQKLQNQRYIRLNIDGKQVYVKNAATYALYLYTPHFHGNRLFHGIYLRYFG